MKPQGHIVISFTLSLFIYYFFRSGIAAFACFAAGSFIDIDHLLDYSINEGKRFRLIDLFNMRLIRKHWDDNYRLRKLYIILHSYEACLLIGLFSGYFFGPLIGAAIFTGYLVHLLTDNLTNYVHPLFYFFFYRIMQGFRAEELYTIKRHVKPPQQSRGYALKKQRWDL